MSTVHGATMNACIVSIVTDSPSHHVSLELLSPLPDFSPSLSDDLFLRPVEENCP